MRLGKNKIEDVNQFKMEFPNEELESERKEVARKFRVVNSDKLEKRGDVWYYENEEVEKWAKKMEDLYDEKSPDDYLRGRN